MGVDCSDIAPGLYATAKGQKANARAKHERGGRLGHGDGREIELVGHRRSQLLNGERIRAGRQLRAELSQQQRDMRMLADVAATKRWLKRQRQLLREAEFDFALF